MYCQIITWQGKQFQHGLYSLPDVILYFKPTAAQWSFKTKSLVIDHDFARWKNERQVSDGSANNIGFVKIIFLATTSHGCTNLSFTTDKNI